MSVPSTPLRVLFLVWKLGGGGAERQLANLARGLAARGHCVAVGVFYSGGEYEQELTDSGVQLVSFEKTGFWDFGGFLRRVVAGVLRFRPTVIHGYMDSGNIVATWMRPFAPGARIVWGIRGSPLEWHRYDRAGRILSLVNRVACRTAHLVVSNSSAAAAQMVRLGYPKERMRVIPNGIDLQRFRACPDQGQALRTEWNVPAGSRLIGMAGRLDPMKDHATYVQAAQGLALRRPDTHFVCVGEGLEPYRSAALATLNGAGLGARFQWRGQVRDMPAFYSALDLFTSSSAFGESSSNVAAEAMACGVPCVLTDVGDARDIVGTTGVIVPPRDPQALASAWEATLDRKGAELSAACRQRIEQRFSVERLVTATERALCELLSPEIDKPHALSRSESSHPGT
jgi:glycosyltransferase involved in cell wall biosynthesis